MDSLPESRVNPQPNPGPPDDTLTSWRSYPTHLLVIIFIDGSVAAYETNVEKPLWILSSKEVFDSAFFIDVKTSGLGREFLEDISLECKTGIVSTLMTSPLISNKNIAQGDLECLKSGIPLVDPLGEGKLYYLLDGIIESFGPSITRIATGGVFRNDNITVVPSKTSRAVFLCPDTGHVAYSISAVGEQVLTNEKCPGYPLLNINVDRHKLLMKTKWRDDLVPDYQYSYFNVRHQFIYSNNPYRTAYANNDTLQMHSIDSNFIDPKDCAYTYRDNILNVMHGRECLMCGRKFHLQPVSIFLFCYDIVTNTYKSVIIPPAFPDLRNISNASIPIRKYNNQCYITPIIDFMPTEYDKSIPTKSNSDSGDMSSDLTYLDNKTYGNIYGYIEIPSSDIALYPYSDTLQPLNPEVQAEQNKYFLNTIAVGLIFILVLFTTELKIYLKHFLREAIDFGTKPLCSLMDRTKRSNKGLRFDTKHLTDKSLEGILNFKLTDILDTGSNGTIVYKAVYKNKHIAVKRIVSNFFNFAEKEIKILSISDGHPNIVKYYMFERIDSFIYIGLELCYGSLYDMIENPSEKEEILNFKMILSKRSIISQIISGMNHLHKLNIAHRDLKPKNILIGPPYYENAEPRLLISDFGMGKIIGGEDLSCTGNLESTGTVGWRAPEIIIRSMNSDGNNNDEPWSMKGKYARVLKSKISYKKLDIFSLGCCIYYIITDGGHPYGNRDIRDINITNMRKPVLSETISRVEHDLISKMISFDPKARPVMSDVAEHPILWSNEKLFSLVSDISDILELKNEPVNSKLILDLEQSEKSLFKNWTQVLPDELMKNFGRFRTYNGKSICSLIRIMRNLRNHSGNLKRRERELIGSTLDEIYTYFDKTFPDLSIYIYNFSRRNLKYLDTRFQDTYFPTNKTLFL